MSAETDPWSELDRLAVRRVVTGQDAHGHSTIIYDDRDGAFGEDPHHGGVAANVLWRAAPGNDPSDASDGLRLHRRMPQGGAQFYVVRIEPRAKVPMHATRTVEYHCVVSGEIVCVLEQGEVTLRAGDVFVQRGTPHGWENRTDRPWISVATMISTRPANA